MAAAAVAAVLPSGATAAPRVALEWDYGTDRPDAPTHARIRLTYGTGEGKAPAFDGLVVRAPAGARLVPGARPLCTADDTALRLMGRDACPAGSHVGGGRITVEPGGVPPMVLDLWAFATPKGIVEVVQYPGSNLTLGFDRLDVEGEAFTAHPPRTPGGPPDGRTTIRAIDLTLAGAGGYVRTPPACATGVWEASAIATFADGAVETATTQVPCAKPPAPAARSRRPCVARRRAGKPRRHDGRSQRCRPGRARRGVAR